MKISAYGTVLVRSPFPLTEKGRDRGAPSDQSITPTLLLPRQRLCRNVILTSGARKNLLFALLVSEHNADSARVRRKADPSLPLRMTRARFFGLRHSLSRGRNRTLSPQVFSYRPMRRHNPNFRKRLRRAQRISSGALRAPLCSWYECSVGNGASQMKKTHTREVVIAAQTA
jgi:hypothetical protein